MKYKLTDTTKIISGIVLYQIEALSTFGDIVIGDRGGWCL